MASANGVAKELLGPPKTKNYRPTLSTVAPYWGGPMGWGYFSLSIIDEMKRDGQVKLTTEFKTAPLHTAEFEVEASDSNVRAFVEEMVDHYWQKSLGIALESLPYGFLGCEALYKDEQGYVKFDCLKPLHPRDTRPFTYQGRLIYVAVTAGDQGNALQYDPSYHFKMAGEGIKQKATKLRAATKNAPAKGVWFTYEPTFRPWYGMPLYAPMWWPWRLKNMPDGAMESALKAFFKHGFMGMVLRHPNEEYVAAPGAPPVSAQEYAQQLGEQAKAGANIALPSTRDEHGQPIWEFEKYGGEVPSNFEHLMAYPDWLDRLISRGGTIPDEIVTHDGNTGGYSRSNIAFLAYLMMEERLLNHHVEMANDQVWQPTVRFNFGPEAWFKVKPKPLLPEPEPMQGNVPGTPPGQEQQPGQNAEETEAVTDEADQVPIEFSVFDSAKHPRGQPKNAGQFGPGGGHKHIAKPKAAAQPAQPTTKRAKASKAVQRIARMPEHTIKQMADFAITISDHYRSGGIKSALKETITQAKKTATERYQQIEGRYGRPAAIAMVATWVGVNAAGAMNPKVWLLAPEPMAMIIGAAEALRALLGKGKADMSEGAQEVLTVEKLYDLVREFDQVLARASGQDPGAITETAFRQALAKFGVDLPEDETTEMSESEPEPHRLRVTLSGPDPDEKPYHVQESLIPGHFFNAPSTQQTFFETGKGPKKPKERKDQGKLFDMSSEDGGHWITIGGHEGEDGKRHGGSPVFVKGGRIIKGHPSLTGKKIDALKEPAEAFGHRKELHQSKEHARAVWGKKARKQGLDAKSLHQLAADMRAHDKAFKGEHTAILQRARELSKKQGFGSLSHFAKAFQTGDSDQLKGFDDIAQSVAAEFPGMLGSDPENRLFEMLAQGNPEPMTEEEAYEQAFDHLMQQQPEEVPFSEMSHQDEIDEEMWREAQAAVPKHDLNKTEMPYRCGKVDGLTVVIVDGDRVKREHSMDFVEAGNGFRWHFIPKGEIWIDDNIECHDWAYNAYHEAMEVRLMRDHGLSYDVAHPRCNVVEKELRERGVEMSQNVSFYHELHNELSQSEPLWKPVEGNVKWSLSYAGE